MIRVCDRVCGPGVAVGSFVAACWSVLLVALRVLPWLTSLFFGTPGDMRGVSRRWILWIGWLRRTDGGIGCVRAFVRSWRAIVSWSPGVASGRGQQCG